MQLTQKMLTGRVFEVRTRSGFSYLPPLFLAAGLYLFLPLASQSRPEAEPQENAYRAPNSYQGKAVMLPIGTTFEGRIQSTIGSSASRPGDRFSVEISAPVLANGTDVLIASGTEIIGEVVEAISSSHQPKEGNSRLHPLGKLRVQLMSIRMPSGVTLPLVASLSGEVAANQQGGGDGLNSRSSSVAYIGSQAGFDAVNPALSNKRDRSGKLAVLKKDDILKDPILGDNSSSSNSRGKVIRSLVKRNRDLYIYSGSPITVKLDAPLKITFAASNSQSAIDASQMEETAPVSKKGGKRFAKERPAPQPEKGEGSAETPSSAKIPTVRSTGAPGSDF